MFLVNTTVTPGRTYSDDTTSASHLRGSCKLRYKQTKWLVLMLQHTVPDTEVWTITHLWGIFPNRPPPPSLNDIAVLETAPLELWLWKEGAGGQEGGQPDRGKYPWASELSGSPQCSPHSLLFSPFVQRILPAFPLCNSLIPYCTGTERKESAGRKSQGLCPVQHTKRILDQTDLLFSRMFFPCIIIWSSSIFRIFLCRPYCISATPFHAEFLFLQYF